MSAGLLLLAAGLASGQSPATTGSPQDNGPRLDRLPIHVVVDETTRSIYRVRDVASITMPKDLDDVDAVVALTKGWLDDHMAASLACLHYRYSLTLRSLSSQWLVATQLGSSECGDGESTPSDIESFLWNRASGKEVSPWDWLAESAPANTPGPALQAIIMKFTRFDSAPSDCREAIESNAEYVVWPTSRGLVFEGMVYSSRACLFETEVPYEALRQFMTKAGLDAAASFQHEKARDLYDDGLQ